MPRVYVIHALPTPVIVSDSGAKRQFSIFGIFLNSIGFGSWDEGWLPLYRRRRRHRH